MDSIPPQVSSANLKKHLLKWDEIGPKWAGTDGEAAAREYVINEMRSYEGVHVEVEEFDFCQWSPLSTTVQITSPVEETLSCVPIAYLANDKIEGDLVYAGSGTEEEFKQLGDQGVDFSDKIVLVTNDVPFAITPLIEEYGAKGLLTISDARMAGLADVARRCAGSFYDTTATAEEMIQNPDSFPAEITGAMLPMSAGHQLLSLLSTTDVTVEIANEASYSIGTTANVIGSVEGETEETVVVGGHYDTEFTAPGTWDNGSGTAGVLELARSFGESDQSLERTVKFILFSCEENGCWGSVNYAQRHKESLTNGCAGMINLDSIGSSVTARNTVWASDSIADTMVETAEMINWQIDALADVDATFSDYAPFRDIGIPNAWIGDFDHLHPYYHTSRDTIEYMNVPDLLDAIEYAGLCTTRLAATDQTLSGLKGQ